MKIQTTIDDPHKLGQVIQQCRMHKDISQRELAKMLGISQKWIWEMEQGKPGILMKRLFNMLDNLGITVLAEFEINTSSGE